MNKHEWNKVKDGLPAEGTLCIVYFPFVINNITSKTVGPIAMAYYLEKEGWVYADTPSPLRFEPCYWRPWDER